MKLSILRFFEFYKKVIHSISFVPAVISIILTVISFSLLTLQSILKEGSSGQFVEYLLVKNAETARVILGTTLTGTIALTVFGFSMMMLVVNQSSSNYSPKVVDTLINNRSNQFILGVYVGTIIFTIITLMQIDSEKVSNGVPGISLIINTILFIYCIFLFIHFINNISNSVRISSIAERIYTKTKKALNQENKYNCIVGSINTDVWINYSAEREGYFQFLRIHVLINILEKENLILKVISFPGQFINSHSSLFQLNKEILNGELLSEIRNSFILYAGEDIIENEFYGFRQLREVAVKALSPGVNDPGVAIICIDYLTSLLCDRLSNPSKTIITDKKGNPRIIINKYDFPTLLEMSFTPIKAYGRKDYTVLNSLLQSLLQISLYDKEKKYLVPLKIQAESIIEEGEMHIPNQLERKFINSTIESLNKSEYFYLPLLKINTDYHP
ncbi:MAG: DUF2254 domain-containing protein [Cytophagaceae bacterium]